MGCGGSKEEATAGHHGPPSASARSPARKATEDSDTDSDIRPRPVVHPPARAGCARAVPAPPAPVLDPRPKRPDDRVNSANRAAAVKYTTPRGNLPLKNVDHIVAKSPAPPENRLREGRFPKVYRNREGPVDNPTRNFVAWEIQQRQGPADGRNINMYEYPVKTLVQPAPFASEFKFARPPATLRECEAPDPNDKAGIEDRWRRPRNDPGPIRAVVNGDCRVIGAIYHPEGDTRGYERARLQPLDRHDRGEIARYDDRQLTGRTTWPQRGPD
ncbi:hypothetical protein C8A01DRAFT_18701 [Parachaetomium inaequale]|uniref:Uncharacterized protein n=1 Tax=Parachaetomium inaequale TaxID=2588326 RepID=A0AAN6SP39_9PEZI|nr:hypothetical protein C8A01DRAFT_18701 [Parachaetomium inaequale]